MAVPKGYAARLEAEQREAKKAKAAKEAKIEKEKMEKWAQMQFVELEVFLKMLDMAARRKVNSKEIDRISKAYVDAVAKHGGPKSKEAQAVLAEFKKLLKPVK